MKRVKNDYLIIIGFESNRPYIILKDTLRVSFKINYWAGRDRTRPSPNSDGLICPWSASNAHKVAFSDA